MKTALCFVILSIGLVATDEVSDIVMAGFYLELGCTPVPSINNSTNTDAYICPDLQPDKKNCYYRGVSYEDGTTIPQNLIQNPCSLFCNCDISPGGEPEFRCAAVDCPFFSYGHMEQHCINLYTLDSCCPSGTVCGEDAIAKLKQCEVDGQMYYEGQELYPKNTYKSCLCTPEWDGRVDNVPYCKDINCGLELHYKRYILNNCAPVFFGSDRSCPIDFICPSSTTNIVRGSNNRNVKEQCVFGNRTLTVGDELTVEEQCTKCSCKVPPFVSCSRNTVCD